MSLKSNPEESRSFFRGGISVYKFCDKERIDGRAICLVILLAYNADDPGLNLY